MVAALQKTRRWRACGAGAVQDRCWSWIHALVQSRNARAQMNEWTEAPPDLELNTQAAWQRQRAPGMCLSRGAGRAHALVLLALCDETYVCFPRPAQGEQRPAPAARRVSFAWRAATCKAGAPRRRSRHSRRRMEARWRAAPAPAGAGRRGLRHPKRRRQRHSKKSAPPPRAAAANEERRPPHPVEWAGRGGRGGQESRRAPVRASRAPSRSGHLSVVNAD